MIVNFKIDLKEHAQKYTPILEGIFKTYAEHLNNTGSLIDLFTHGQNVDITRKNNNLFRKSGEGYEIKYKNNPRFWLKALIGLSYIEYLLMNPNKEIHVMQLLHVKDGKESITLDKIPYDDSLQGFSALESVKYSYSDLNYIYSHTKKLESDLKNAKKNNHFSKVEEITGQLSEIEYYIKQFKRDTVNPEIEKQRARVTKAISEAIKRVKNYDIQLYFYLKQHINTGYSMSYTPSNKITWLFS